MSCEDVLCPSSVCREGAILVGIVTRDGRIAFSANEIVVNSEFVRVARTGRTPEKRFRFVGRCIKNGCTQWTGSRCGVIDSLTSTAGGSEDQGDLPRCSIRARCRWFHQSGPQACSICPDVITDLRENTAIEPSEVPAVQTGSAPASDPNESRVVEFDKYC